MEYGVFFSGKTVEGRSPGQVRENFARLFPQAGPARLERIFSGREILLKKGLSAEAAEKYRQALQRAGAECEIRRLDAPPAAAPAPATGLTLLPVAGDRTSPPPPPPEKNSAAADDARAVVRTAVIKGSGAGYGDLSIMPDAARGLCWGGFFMPWIWGSFNGVEISFLALPGMRLLSRLVPLWLLFALSLLMSLFMLVRGRELAWQNRNWDSAEHFNRVQKRWTMAGLALALALAVLLPHWLSRTP